MSKDAVKVVKKRGGPRAGSGRKEIFGEPSYKLIRFVPKSKKDFYINLLDEMINEDKIVK